MELGWTRLLRSCLWLVVLQLLAVGSALGQSQSKEAAPPLACAVVGTGSSARAQALCEGIGRELGRPTLLVEDGSNVERGESLHIVQGDVVWTIVWLRDGEPRAFIRVSTTDAAGRETSVLAKASRVLIREANKASKGCLRVEPNGGRPMRGFDLAYPWVSLKQCRVQMVDVIDPWWSAPQAKH